MSGFLDLKTVWPDPGPADECLAPQEEPHHPRPFHTFHFLRMAGKRASSPSPLTQRGPEPPTGPESLGISGNTCVYLISCQNGRTKALLVSDLWEFQTWKGHGHRRERPEKEARLKDEARVGGQNRVLFLKPVGRRSARSVKQTPAGSFLFPPETGAGRWEGADKGSPERRSDGSVSLQNSGKVLDLVEIRASSPRTPPLDGVGADISITH